MNGWWRLLIVIAAPFCLLAFVIGYSEANVVYSTDIGVANAEAANLTGRAWDDAVWRENMNAEQFKFCDATTVRITQAYYEGPYAISCNNEFFHSAVSGLEYAIPVALLFAAIGMVIGWIYRGFRPSP